MNGQAIKSYFVSLPSSLQPKYDDAYKPIKVTWRTFFNNESRSTESGLSYGVAFQPKALLSASVYRSTLTHDLAQIAAQASERKKTEAAHPLQELAREALGALAEAGKPVAEWSRHIASEITNAAD